MRDRLFREGYRFDFFQAVRLLEAMYAGGVPVGEGADPEHEPVRFSARPDLAFPAAEVAGIATLHPSLKQLGLACSDLTPALARKMAVPPGAGGVVLTDVHPTSSAFREARLRAGMRITDLLPLPAQTRHVPLHAVGDGGLPLPQYEVDTVDALEAYYRALPAGAAFLLRVVPPNAEDARLIPLTKPAARRALMEVNFMGLAGQLGPLPAPYTEVILDRTAQRDTAFRDFLDLFNHRLISLLYRARKHHHIGLALRSPDQTPLASYLFALMGLGTEGLRARLAVPDRALLRYAGLIAQKPHSAAGLEALLSDYFRLPARVQPFIGRWRALDPEQTTRIAPVGGQNNRLGVDTVLGAHVWQQQSRFDLHLGPLTLPAFLGLLPTGTAHASLCALTRFYVDHHLDFGLVLELAPGEAPAPRLGTLVGPRLGWTAWLAGAPDAPPARVVMITPRGAVPRLRKLQLPFLQGLPAEVLEQVYAAMRPSSYEAGMVIARAGHPATSVFVVEEGSVHVVRAGAEGRSMVLAARTEGDAFGGLSLTPDKRYPNTFVAAERCRVLELSQAALERLAQHPAVARAVERYQGRHETTPRHRLLADHLRALRVPLLADLPPEGFYEVARQVTLLRLRRGAPLARQGTPAVALHVLLQGAVWEAPTDADAQPPARRGPGTVVGFPEVLFGDPHRASVTADEPVEVAVLTRAALGRLLARYPAFEHRLLTHRRRPTAQPRGRHGR